ncbi:hypothetical protein [Streptomyces sp. MMG1121]|uniref:hypothetical protein n=1 Tax=Streptomyces sp. MMG1121 TaxID=1415544 RepID=UPI000A597CD3
MNSITERWIRACRRELLDRSLSWDQRQLLHVLREIASVEPFVPAGPVPHPTTSARAGGRARGKPSFTALKSEGGLAGRAGFGG